MTEKEFKKYPHFIQALVNLKMMAAGAGLQDIGDIVVHKNSLEIKPNTAKE